MSFDWKSVVGTVAPTLATALGGPLAGAAVSAIATALGLPTNATDKDVENAIQKLTPEQIVKLKQANLEFQAKMKELDIDLVRLSVEDRKSAREREVNSGDSATPRLLAIGAIAMFALTLVGTFILAFIPELKISESVTYLLGAVQSAATLYVKSIYDYYLGNNSESGLRDQMIYHSTPIKNTEQCAQAQKK